MNWKEYLKNYVLDLDTNPREVEPTKDPEYFCFLCEEEITHTLSRSAKENLKTHFKGHHQKD